MAEDENSKRTTKPSFDAAVVQTYIKDAISKWNRPLKQLEPSLVKDVRIITKKHGCGTRVEKNGGISDFSIFLVKQDTSSLARGQVIGLYHHSTDGDPNRSSGSFIKIFLGAIPTLQLTILHEFGHAYGLADTYSGAGCKLGQPRSIMCNRMDSTKDLTSDDLNGVRFSFCKFHGQKAKYKVGCEKFARTEPGKVANIDRSGEASYSLGIEGRSETLKFVRCEVSKPQTFYDGQGKPVIENAHFKSFEIMLGQDCKTAINQKYPDLTRPPHTVSSHSKSFQGFKILEVKPGGIAAASGLKVGDYLSSIAVSDKRLYFPSATLEEIENTLKFFHYGAHQVQIDYCRIPPDNLDTEICGRSVTSDGKSIIKIPKVPFD